MAHPDPRVEQALATLSASETERSGAEQLFQTWEQMAEFFMTVFSDAPALLVLAVDVSSSRLRSSYEVDGVDVPTLGLLRLAVMSGGTLSEDRERIALVFRALIFADPGVISIGKAAEVFRLWEDLRYFDTEGLRVFDSYDITSSRDRAFVHAMLQEHRIPCWYVRDIAGMPGLYPAGAKAFHSLGVPAKYAVEVAQALAGIPTRDFYGGDTPTPQAIGSTFERLKTELGDSVGQMTVTWHISALYLELVPAAYAAAAGGRAVVEIVHLHGSGIPESYLRAVGPCVKSADVLRGYRDGIAAEYLRELAG